MLPADVLRMSRSANYFLELPSRQTCYRHVSGRHAKKGDTSRRICVVHQVDMYAYASCKTPCCITLLFFTSLDVQNSSASTKTTFLPAFLGHQMLTGTVRHVFLVQIGHTTIPRKTWAIVNTTGKINRVYKLSP